MPWVEDEQVRSTMMKAGFGRGFNFSAAAEPERFSWPRAGFSSVGMINSFALNWGS
jgi:hypothetical protein